MGVVELERATRRLSTVLGVRFCVVRDRQVWIGLLDAEMTGHIDLQDDLHAAVDGIFLNVLDVLWRIGETGCVTALFGKPRESGNLERPGLGLGDVQVHDVHLGHGEAIDGPLDVVHCKPVTTNIEEHASMRKAWEISNGYRRQPCVHGLSRAVLEEELRKGLESSQHARRGGSGD